MTESQSKIRQNKQKIDKQADRLECNFHISSSTGFCALNSNTIWLSSATFLHRPQFKYFKAYKTDLRLIQLEERQRSSSSLRICLQI